MCGIFGGSGDLNARVLTALGCLNEKRGEDSAGIGWALSDGTPTIAKVAQHPLVAFPKTLQTSVNRAAKSGRAIGHTRAATHGGIKSENAHPFLVDGIAWVHNGIIDNHAKFGKYEVDSESLIHGIKLRSFKKYEGSVALLWIEQGAVHAFRKGNPLWRGRIGHGVYFASEANMLHKVGCEKIKELAEGIHYTFHGNQIKRVERIPANTPWTVAMVEPYRAVGFTPHYSGRYRGKGLAKESEVGYWTREGWKSIAVDGNGHAKDVVDQMELNHAGEGWAYGC